MLKLRMSQIVRTGRSARADHSDLLRSTEQNYRALGSVFGMLPILILLSINLHLTATNASEIGQAVRENLARDPDCLFYQDSTFSLACNLDWSATHGSEDFILLKVGETFNGNNFEIDLSTLSGLWEGMFQIEGDVEPHNAPVINHLHMRGGGTTTTGGFIVQGFQENFIVDSCSSSGTINGKTGCAGGCQSGGGICGDSCTGTIVIKNSWSTGPISGQNSGGIAGRLLGRGQNGVVTIINCRSEGDMSGRNSGGLSGSQPGLDGGFVNFTNSHSTGEISGDNAGGLCGPGAARDGGDVEISQCYSTGEISGEQGGGLVGQRAGWSGGTVRITNSYSWGDITGSDNAGGICGQGTGYRRGIVIVDNVYAGGKIEHEDAAGIVGSAATSLQWSDRPEEIRITMSVYDNGGPIIGAGSAEQIQNSNNLAGLIGEVYCYDNSALCWDTKVWKAVPGELPILQAQTLPLISPLPTITAKATPSSTITTTHTTTPTLSRTQTQTSTPSLSRTSTGTETITPISSCTRTQTPTPSSSRTSTGTNTMTPTLSTTWTQTPARSPTRTPADTSTPTASRTRTRTATSSSTTTQTGTPAKTQTPNDTMRNPQTKTSIPSQTVTSIPSDTSIVTPSLSAVVPKLTSTSTPSSMHTPASSESQRTPLPTTPKHPRRERTQLQVQWPKRSVIYKQSKSRK